MSTDLEIELGNLMVEAYTAQKASDLSKAIQLWNKVLKHSACTKELEANCHLSLGNLHQAQGKDDLAYKDLTKAIQLDENFYQAYYNRGTLLKRMGKTTKADKDLAKAKDLAQNELEQKQNVH